MSRAQIITGDALAGLRTLPDGAAQTCVTSPPYWGLRDYGVDGQIGLEQTPEQYVARLVDVFRDVRRVLRDDGTLWLNLGDSYNAAGREGHGTRQGYKQGSNRASAFGTDHVRPTATMLKPKDLVGIPWMAAQALRNPFYAGRIKREADRAWIAAMIDGEGTICGFEHERSDGDGIRTGIHITITNSSQALLDEAARIWPASRSEHQTPSDSHIGNRPTWRWIVHGAENKALFLREVYPYLIAKKKQAVLGYTLALLMMEAKKLGHSPQRDAVRERRATIVRLMSDANQGRPCDVPAWCVEPPSVHEPGWYLRSDIIWAKPNPMPESVTDRPTKAHEYLFLLAKSERYYFDADAIREEGTGIPWNSAKSTLAANGIKNIILNQTGQRRTAGADTYHPDQDQTGRNRRTVWTIATQPFSGAHFATMPPKLVEPCVLAGSRHGDTVLDPFAGAGTTGLVALRHGRSFIGCELNPEYAEIARSRIHGDAPLLHAVEVLP